MSCVRSRSRLVPFLTLVGGLVWIVATVLSRQQNQAGRQLSRGGSGPHAPSRFGNPISEVYNFIYIHIPYSGGKATSRSFLLDDARKKYGPSAPLPVETLQHAMEYYKQDPASYVKAAMIRHPCSRFVETFRSLHERYLDDEKGLSGAVKRILGKYPDLFDNVRTVSDFTMKLTINKQWESIQRDFFQFASMTWYVFLNNGEFGLDRVICNEHPEHGLDKLEQALDLKTEREKQQFQALRLQLKEDQAEDLCEDLPLITRQAIAQNYALDMCVFKYDSAITHSRCAGDVMTKDDFTAHYRSCKAKLAQHEQQRAEEWKSTGEYSYVKQIQAEPTDSFILDIPLH